ncbi:MAG TPA: ribonuclease H-like YkuK family protein [Cryomorphaceae bacterium]|nr:ribonuclease H-like YkuK family protein [Cryomorphaceae bacterium]
MDRIFRKMGNRQEVELESYVKQLLHKNPGVKIYVGSDSQNYATKTLYATTVVFRYEKNGAHVIYHRESTPLVTDMWSRLWGELQRSIDVAGYLKFECDVAIEQIDLDLNSDPSFPSNKVFQAAVGYAQSMGYKAKTKPDLLMATWAANVLVN